MPATRPDASSMMLRLDGLLYRESEDARIRNDVLRNTLRSKDPTRVKMAEQYTRFVNKHLEMREGKGKLFILADGDRAFEHAKDVMLFSLIRAGVVPIAEVQAQAWPAPRDVDASRRMTSPAADSG